MKKLNLFAVLSFLLLIASTSAFAQQGNVIGKLYSKADADQIYGAVKSSMSIDTQTLKSLAGKSSDYLMFNVASGKLIILNKKRGVLYSSDMSTSMVAANVPFHVFSTSKVLDLISAGGNSATTYVELRNNDVLTVTNGVETLEQSTLCPPLCP